MKKLKNNFLYLVVLGGRAEKANIELRFNIKDETKIIFNPGEIELSARGNISLNLDKKKISGLINLDANENGSLFLAGKGFWDGLEFKAKARINKFRLSILQDILKNDSKFITKGNVNANLNIGVKDGEIACKGKLLADNIKLKVGTLSNILTTKNTTPMLKSIRGRGANM